MDYRHFKKLNKNLNDVIHGTYSNNTLEPKSFGFDKTATFSDEVINGVKKKWFCSVASRLCRSLINHKDR